MIKVFVIGIVAAFIALILRQYKAEYSILVVLAAAGITFYYAIEELSLAVEFIDDVKSKFPIDNIFFIQLLKMLGISYCAEFSSNICKEMGHIAIASQIEMFAKLGIIVMSLPALYYFLNVVEAL